MLLGHRLGARLPSSHRGPSPPCAASPLVFGTVAALAWLSVLACTRTQSAQGVDRTQGVDGVEAAAAPGDLDGDGLQDALEDTLAERFAPIVLHGERESTFPTNVDRWLTLTDLYFAGEDGIAQLVVARPLQQSQLIGHTATVEGLTVSSDGSRSRGKRVSFFLGNVPAGQDAGSLRPGDWVTYVHSYPNTLGGITLQYWRAYARNDASVLGIDLSHGGDWEAVAVHFDRQQRPAQVTYLDHSEIVDVTKAVKWEGSHSLVWSEEGTHSSYPDASHSRSVRWFRHETWTGGAVTRWGSSPVGASGGLLNIGETTRPRNGQLFVRYSGLWGARHRFFMTSGYWGPAFNETDATCDAGTRAYRPYLRRPAEQADCGRIRLNAWCDKADRTRLNNSAACYAASDVP
jgi:hypothetical protein